jgi:hypothetical protein
MSILYCTVTGTPKVITASINSSHGSPTTSAIITTNASSLDIGDAVTIVMGYVGSNSTIFKGYVKQIEKNVPDNLYTITCSDKMIRAVDYFIAAEDPNNVLTYKNKTAESLVQDLMAMSGLNSFTYDQTYFTFGVTHDFEINNVPCYDYCRTIADILTWHLWCDINGTVHFENRKPYVMTGDTGQPGDTTDERPEGYAAHTVTTGISLNASWSKSEKDLRNRVIVYGVNGIHATAQASSPYLPSGFYKTVVADLQSILDSQSEVDRTADYNLNLLNRLTYGMKVNIVGDSTITAREILRIKNTYLGVDSNWYSYGCEHQFSPDGYTTALDLRQ